MLRRFPAIEGPKNEDICFATTNRQHAVKAIAPGCDAVLVIGAAQFLQLASRLVEVAARAGCQRAILVQRAEEIDWASLDGIRRLGVSAGASAPEVLVHEVIEACRRALRRHHRAGRGHRETVAFNLPLR